MHGMIRNWKTIGNTSISGLRETFLQRKGKLQLKEDGMWYLTVEPGVFDMLLDSLPWRFSVIKHAWMGSSSCELALTFSFLFLYIRRS